MDVAANPGANKGAAQAVPSAPDGAIVRAATLGKAKAWTIMAAVCLVMVALGVFAAQHVRFLAKSVDDRASMAGAHPTVEQAGHEVPMVLDGATAGCGSCDARHRNLGRLDEAKAP